jgi:ArsR family transcriptional regulator, arsenate/arsenite/antimonite-responsive transcriptional repressor
MLSKTRRRHTHSFQDLQDYFRTLSDAARLEILDLLASSNDLTVGDLARRLDISQPLCSWHIRRLVKLGVVRIKRVGREARCSLDRGRLKEYQRAFKNWLALG